MTVKNVNILTLLVFSILTIIFVFLKLTETVNWSWFIVFSPIWLPTILIAIGLFVVIKTLPQNVKKGRRD